MKKCLGIILVTMCIHLAHGQVQLFVKKGTIQVSKTTYEAGAIVTIKKTDEVITGDKTQAIAKKNAQLTELDKNKKYSYKQLINKLEKQTSFTEAFIKSITSSQITKKGNGGSTQRGVQEDPLDYFPSDSVEVLVDSLLLEIGAALRLTSDVKVYRVGSRDTISFSKEYFTFLIKDLVPGTYFWQYSAKIGKDAYRFKNVFFVPISDEKKKHLAEIDSFRTQLSGFTNEMQELLMEEYLAGKRWVSSAVIPQ